jgi:predicted ester cyclase
MKISVEGRLAAAGLALVLAMPAAATEIHCAGNEAMLTRYLEMFDKVFNGRDLSVVEAYVSPEFRNRYAPPGAPTGPALIKSFVAGTAKIFPKRKLTNDLIVCKDDMLIASQTIEATWEGPFMGVPANGKSYKITGIDIYRYKDGMMVEQWGDYDVLGMMKQMGFAVTAPSGAAIGPSDDPAAKAANRAPVGK